MPKIQMKTLACGPTGTYRPGENYEVSDEVAADLVAGRYAVLVDESRSTEAPADAPPADAPPADAPPADAPPADAPPADAPASNP